jgi:hypothetical protein
MSGDDDAPLEGCLTLLDDTLDAPGMREVVNALLMAEMEAMAARGEADEASFVARLPPLPPLSSSALVSSELQRVARGERLSVISAVGYALPPPPSGAAADDPAAWEAAARGARLAYEAQGFHALNLEMAARFGSDAWHAAVMQAASITSATRGEVAALTAALTETTAARRAVQLDAGARLGEIAKRARQCDDTIIQLGVGLGADSF